MKRPVFPGPFRRGLRRLGAAGLAAGTLWAVVVTAGSDSASAAWAALRAASPLAALKWELGDLWADDDLSPAAVMTLGESPLLLSARADNSRGDSPNVITAAGERSSSAHRSPSSHFSAASGDAARKAAQAADALSLPAVTTTAQRVPAASPAAPSRRSPLLNGPGKTGLFISPHLWDNLMRRRAEI